MKQVYFYDENKKFISYDVIDDAAEIPANATAVKPVDSNGVGLYDPTWNESTHSWDSLTEEEWNQKHPAPVPKPESTQDQQILAALAKQVMQLLAANVQQQKTNASSTKQLMDLAKGGN